MCEKCNNTRLTMDYSRVVTVVIAAAFGFICGLIIIAKFF